MAKYRRFEDLECYQLVVSVTCKCHQLFQKKELQKEYEFKAQMLAALISISNNIAEGFEYNNNADFIRFLRYAKGSAGESRNILNVLKACELVSKVEYAKLYEDFTFLSKQISGFKSYLEEFEAKKNAKPKKNKDK